jgi:hypothetical protein
MLTRSQLKEKIRMCLEQMSNPVYGPTTRSRANTIREDITQVSLQRLIDIEAAINIEPVTTSQGKFT